MSDMKFYHVNYKNKIRLNVGFGLPWLRMNYGFIFYLFNVIYLYQKVGIELFSAVVINVTWGGKLQKDLEFEAKYPNSSY